MPFISLKKIFYFLFPISSFLVFPFIQGTTPAFVLCFVFFLFMPLLVASTRWPVFYLVISALFLILTVLTFFSQIGVFFSNILPVKTLVLVNEDATGDVFLRSSIFTQLLYFLAAVIAFSFIVNFFDEKDLGWIFGGIRLLIIYGMIEWLAYFLTGNEIDFLSNRVFDEDTKGSFFQVLSIGGVSFQRMKSLTGEPSQFAFTILPFWVIAIELKRKTDVALTTIALVLSVSTTALLGIFVYGMYKLLRSGWKLKLILISSFAVLLTILMLFFGDIVNELWQELVIAKVTAESVSGQDRWGSFYSCFEYWKNSNLWVKTFGLGFGIVRSTDFLSTVLINNGILGIAFWVLLFFTPFFFVRKKLNDSMDRKLLPAILVVFTTFFLSVPEYMYLSIWVPLGIVYNMRYKQAMGSALMQPDLLTNK